MSKYTIEELEIIEEALDICYCPRIANKDNDFYFVDAEDSINEEISKTIIKLNKLKSAQSILSSLRG